MKKLLPAILILLGVATWSLWPEKQVPESPKLGASTDKAYFVQVVDGVVVNRIVATQEMIDTGNFGDASLWIKTEKKGVARDKSFNVGDLLSADKTTVLSESFSKKTPAIITENVEPIGKSTTTPK